MKCSIEEVYSEGKCVSTKNLRDYERQLIEGMSPEEAQRIVNLMNAITKNINMATAVHRAEHNERAVSYFGHHYD
jgi:hypothetical protein